MPGSNVRQADRLRTPAWLARAGAALIFLTPVGTYAQDRGDLNRLEGEIQSQRSREAELTRKSEVLAADLAELRQRAIGAARSGDIPRARAAVDRLEALRKAAVDAKLAYWPDPIEIQRREAAAWLAMAEGRKDEAVALMKDAVALEASIEKHPVTPGPVLPARELEGDLLMALGRSAEALAAYEASLAVAPNRYYALGAAVRAADAAGRGEAARAHFATLAKVAARADGSRVEFAKLKAIAGGAKR